MTVGARHASPLPSRQGGNGTLIGDKLVIEQHHTDRAKEICDLVESRLSETFVITVAGESGSGKSELATEIAQDQPRDAAEQRRTGRAL